VRQLNRTLRQSASARFGFGGENFDFGDFLVRGGVRKPHLELHAIVKDLRHFDAGASVAGRVRCDYWQEFKWRAETDVKGLGSLPRRKVGREHSADAFMTFVVAVSLDVLR
jgi:hypothetical protein